MVPKRGQPPKGEDKRKSLPVYLSSNEKEVIEDARSQEAPDRRIGAYIRDVAVDHAKKVSRDKK